MNKRIWAFLLALILTVSLQTAVFAEHQDGGSDWSVTFTSDGKINNNLPRSRKPYQVSSPATT